MPAVAGSKTGKKTVETKTAAVEDKDRLIVTGDKYVGQKVRELC